MLPMDEKRHSTFLSAVETGIMRFLQAKRILMKAIGNALIFGLFWVLSLLPLSFLQLFGRIIGRLAWWLNTDSRRITEENLLICFPELTDTERSRLAKERLQHLGMTSMEMAYVWLRPVDTVLKKVTSVTGHEHVDTLLAQGKGVILLAPHIGNWEAFGPYLSDHFTITNLYQPPDNPFLDQIIYKARSRSGAQLAPTNTSGVKALLRALKRGEMVGILPDQVPARGSGEFASFYSVPAYTAVLPYNLIQRTGAKAVLGYALRNIDKGGFDIVFEPVPDTFYSEDQLQSLTALNQTVEQAANVAVSQYQWEYKRFKRQPNDERKYYNKH